MQINPDPSGVTVQQVSLSVVRLEMMFGENVAAVGSAFLWARGGKTVLVTAWHNLTGTHPLTGNALSSMGTRPDRFRAYFLTDQTGAFQVLNQNLYLEDGSPGWIIHGAVGERVDVAVVPLSVPPPPNLPIMPINEIASQPMATPVGSDVFIVGFPKGLSESGLPIWKRGSLASEPGLFADLPGRRRVLVDSATREGLSGAPVVARSMGMYLREDGGVTAGDALPMRPVGVYTGRLATHDSFDAQLGIVWPFPLVDAIIDNGVVDTFDRDGSFTPRATD